MRLSAARLRHGSVLRKASILLLKQAAAANRGVLQDKVHEIRPLDSPGLAFGSVDSMVLDTVFWFGTRGYEGLLPQLWAGFCAQASDIVEIGGSVGLHTVIGGKTTAGSYTVVEPVPHVATALRDNLARNGLSRIDQLEAAAIPGREARQVSLSIPDEKRGIPVGSHLLNGVELSTRGSLRIVDGAGTFFRSLMERCDLIKIDAEGIEAVLLEGAIDILSARKPTLVVEVLPESIHLADVLERSSREGSYHLYIIPEWGPHPIISVRSDTFSARLPSRFHAKDVILTKTPLDTGAIRSVAEAC